MQVKHIRYCLTGIGLRSIWSKLASSLINSGMTWHQIRDCQNYQEALSQYKDHLKSCPICRSDYKAIEGVQNINHNSSTKTETC